MDFEILCFAETYLDMTVSSVNYCLLQTAIVVPIGKTEICMEVDC